MAALSRDRLPHMERPKPQIRLLSEALCVAALLFVSMRAAAQEIWMFAGPYVKRPALGWEGVRRDMADMWTDGAPWETVSRELSVIQFPPTSVDRAGDADLRQATSQIKRRNIAFAVGTGLLIRSDRCRSRSEAYVDREALEGLFAKLRRDGADVKYVTMDEPYFYGHKDSGPTACHESAQALARGLVQGIAIARKYFPNVRIGTDEVVTKDRPWVDEVTAWADTYRQITGEKLAYLHADLSWKSQSVRNLVPLREALRARGIPLGVTYDAAAKGEEPWFDANSQSNSDVRWVQNAVSHYTQVESVLGDAPDHAVFSTWVHYPTRMLPETQPGAFTNLVYQYIQHREAGAGGRVPRPR
jgi:hypothetical protein